MSLLENVIQAVLLVAGPASIWMVNSKCEQQRRRGAWIGLIAQPFWLLGTYLASQWGMFFASLVYLAAWIRGVRNHSRNKDEHTT